VAVLFPIVIAIVLALVQATLWAHAGAIAQAAADHGVEVASTLGSSDEAGVDAAQDFVANAGLVRDVSVLVSAESDSSVVALTVTGSYPTIFGRLSISASAATVREQVDGP